MSWEHLESLDDVAPIGRRIRADVLHVDWAWERVSLLGVAAHRAAAVEAGDAMGPADASNIIARR
ncbi:hypothetical protein GCM10010193_23020 [Kitasatospora atroaurantiaca]|nr:hypothetical protein [Kitasatospora atroaurantiaca]